MREMLASIISMKVNFFRIMEQLDKLVLSMIISLMVLIFLLGEDGAPFLDKNATKAYSIEGKCWVNNHAHILKPLCNFNYLMYYLNQVDYKDYVNGSTRLKLTQSDMRSIKILLPPMAEQERISTKVKELFYLLDNISYFL